MQQNGTASPSGLLSVLAFSCSLSVGGSFEGSCAIICFFFFVFFWHFQVLKFRSTTAPGTPPCSSCLEVLFPAWYTAGLPAEGHCRVQAQQAHRPPVCAPQVGHRLPDFSELVAARPPLLRLENLVVCV